MSELRINPYEAPSAACDVATEMGPEQGPNRPAYKLYSVAAVVVATALGSPIAGGIIMAINFRRLGRTSAAVHAVVWTVLFTAGLLAVAQVLPEETPNAVFIVPQLFGMYALAKGVQESALETHQRQGGRRASVWGAVGLSLLVGVILGVAFFAVAWLIGQ